MADLRNYPISLQDVKNSTDSNNLKAVVSSSSLIFNFTSNLRISQTDFHKAEFLSFCLEEMKLLPAVIVRQQYLLSLANVRFWI